MNHSIALIGREKVVNMHFLGVRTYTVDTSDALHQSCGVPRCVVVEDNIGTMQVHAFGKHFGGNDDVIVVALF